MAAMTDFFMNTILAFILVLRLFIYLLPFFTVQFHLETVCQQFWPEDTEVGTKLQGQAVELQQTVDFLDATGLRT